jgi:hypothetical protein
VSEGYCITINRKGESLETEYGVVPSPAQPTSADIIPKFKEKPINLEALFAGGRHNVSWSRATSGLRMLRRLLRLRVLLTELPFAPLHRQRSIVPNTWSQSVVLTP